MSAGDEIYLQLQYGRGNTFLLLCTSLLWSSLTSII